MERDQSLPRDCWMLCSPDGPDTPFGAGILWYDILRVIVMLMGMTIIVFTPRLMLSSKSSGQRARMAGQACFALVVIGTEVDHIGDYAHYRLFLTFVGVSLMLWGFYRLQFEFSPQSRPRRNE